MSSLYLFVVENDDVGREEGGVDCGGAVLEGRLDLDHELRLLLLESIEDVLRQGEDLLRTVYDLKNHIKGNN